MDGTPAATRPPSLVPQATIAVRVTPGAKRNEVSNMADGALRIKVAAPAVDGRANEALIYFVSQLLHVRPRQVTIFRGQTSRQNLLHIDGLSQAQAEAMLSRQALNV